MMIGNKKYLSFLFHFNINLLIVVEDHSALFNRINFGTCHHNLFEFKKDTLHPVLSKSVGFLLDLTCHHRSGFVHDWIFPTRFATKVLKAQLLFFYRLNKLLFYQNSIQL